MRRLVAEKQHGLTERPDEYLLRMKVPGLEPKDIEVSVESRLLQVRCEHHAEKERRGRGRRRRGGLCGCLVRWFHLPADAENEGLKTEYRHGLLTVHLPRKDPCPRCSALDCLDCRDLP